MASPLESLIRNEVARGFRGQLLTGTLRRTIPGDGVDEFGDPLPDTVETYSFNGMRQDFDAAYRARAGIPQTDVGILIIAGSVSTDVRQDDQFQLRGTWYQGTALLERDPANATVLVQAHEIEDPTT